MRVTHTRDRGRERYGFYFRTVSNSDYLNLHSLRHSFEIVGADRRHEQCNRQHDKECQAPAFAPRHSLLLHQRRRRVNYGCRGKSGCKNCPALSTLAELFNVFNDEPADSEIMVIHAEHSELYVRVARSQRTGWRSRNGKGPDQPLLNLGLPEVTLAVTVILETRSSCSQ